MLSNFYSAQITIDYIDFQKDPIPKVINNIGKKVPLTTLELDKKPMDISTIFGIDPEGIESINRKTINSNEEKLIIKTKQSYAPKLISVLDLLNKEDLNLKDFVIFIDRKPIYSELAKVFIDENFILQIKTDNIQSNKKENLALVSIFTKSKKNIDEAKTQKIK